MDAILAALHNVPAIKTVFHRVPNRVPRAKLPAAFTTLGPAEGWPVPSRSYQVTVLAAPVAQGGFGDGHAKVEQIAEQVWDAMMDCDMRITNLSDSGHVIITFGNTDYHGITFTVKG